jgi:uncharacterized lipoprotein NlpE involved in copper resistance
MKQQLLALCILIIFTLIGCDNIQSPSESQVKEACKRNIYFYGEAKLEDFVKIEFGNTMTSQGGLTDKGAPAGTKIYPVKITIKDSHGAQGTVTKYVFKDSFGEWVCRA